MKKILAIALATLLLVTCVSVFFASAEDAENVAPKATYEVHEFFRQGGKEVNWGWDDNADIAYPDETGKTLIDGVFAEDCSYGDAAWVGVTQAHPDFHETAKPLYVDFTLDQAYTVKAVRIHVNNLNASGIGAPAAITAQLTENGTEYLGAFEADPVDGEACWYQIELSKDTDFLRLNLYSQVAAQNALKAGTEDWLAQLARDGYKNTWVFIDEIEILSSGEAEQTPDPDPEMETIEIDGKLDDTGWAEARWIEISEESGLGGIQDTPETKTPFEFDTQLRTDDEYVYIAAVIHLPMENSTGVGSESVRGGTSFRFWVHSSDDYAQYTHFYDVWPDANGDPVTAAKYNTSKTENSGAAIENSSLTATIKADGDNTIVEMRVRLDEFLEEGATEIHYYVNPVKGFTSGEFVGMVYPEIPLNPAEDSKMPWLNWDTEHQGVLDLAESALGALPAEPSEPVEPSEPDPDEGYEEAIAAKVGDALPAAPLFKTELAAEVKDGTVTLKMTIKDVKEEDKIIGFQIPVYYDAERVTPVLDDVVDDALNCMKDGLPGDNWENLTAAKSVEKNGEVYVYFQAGTAKTDYCKSDLIVTLTFTMNEGFEKAGFWTANATTKCFVDDGQMTTFNGEGSYTIAEEEAAEPSEPTEPTEPTEPIEPSEPTPGDAGVIVFAILGVLAIVGAAVVIKVRK